MSRRKQKQRPKARAKRKKQDRQPRRRQVPSSRIDFVVPRPDLARSPIYVDGAGAPLGDPLARLGLSHDEANSKHAVQAAFRDALAKTPPEKDPEGARELVVARDLLLKPEYVLSRALGDLRVPDATQFVPGHERGEAPERGSGRPRPDWSSRSRLVAIMTLYAILGDDLEGSRRGGASTGRLFD